MAVPRCPNCGAETYGGWYVCQDCGKVFCCNCEKNGKNPNPMGCPRCASLNWIGVQDWKEYLNAVKNSQN